MSDNQPIPWPGIILALVAGLFMLLAGTPFWAALVVVVVWIGSILLYLPPPQTAPARVKGMQLTRDGIRQLIEHSSIPLLLLDDGRVVLANRAAREVVGQHVIGQDPRVALRHPAAVELLTRPEGGSTTIRGLTGPRSIWQMTRHPVDERYWLVELVNRTAEADISRAHTDFVANASHELRTPLASIIGYLETLADEGEDYDPKRAARFHATALREARRLESLVDDLMSLSRVEAEKHDQPTDEMNLGPLVQQAARDAAGPDRQDRIVYVPPEEPLIIKGERQQLEQLVRNLVDNALKYGSPDTPVTATLSRDKNGMAVLSVQDRGDGIDPQHIPHLTRRFYRTDPGRSRAAGGTGLGLAIVKHIVERHRGRLDITSQLREGTTVTVRFPTVADEGDGPPHSTAGADVIKAKRNGHIGDSTPMDESAEQGDQR